MVEQRAISRRRFVQTTAASSLALAGMGRGRPSWAQSTKPNIVFILADDLGYADVGCYGQRDYTTPNIDRLATEGLKFTQAYSNSPDCSATRTALITGRYQARLPLGLEEPLSPLTPKDIGLPPSHPTLPSLLKKAGYGTTLIGKWHLGYLPDFSPLKSGYDHFFGILGCCADYFNHGAEASQAYVLPVPGLAHQLHEQEVPVERHGYMTNLLGDRAVQSVESYASSKEPFLLSCISRRHIGHGKGRTTRQSRSGSGTLLTVTAALRKPTRRWCKVWTPILVACCRRSTRAVSPATPWSSSLATMAANDSLKCGRSPA